MTTPGGGGGSIGSELCRQIASHNPKQLIIFDIYENNAYDIQLELKKKYPELKLEAIIGSVRDSRKIWQVFDTYRPDIVYHAAAHKHVPLMEDGSFWLSDQRSDEDDDLEAGYAYSRMYRALS